MANVKNFADAAYQVADAVAQEREAWIAEATEAFRQLGSAHPEQTAYRAWTLIQNPSLGIQEDGAGPACVSADSTVQEREEWIAAVAEGLRADGVANPEALARRAWEVSKNPSLGASADGLI